MKIAEHCILGEDYDESCESKLCPQKQLCRRLKRNNDRNPYDLYPVL